MNLEKMWKDEVSYIIFTAKSTVQAVHCDFASKKCDALISY